MKYLEVKTSNTTQIVSTDDLKTHLRITFSQDDDYIDLLERAAVGMVEEYTNRFLLQTQLYQFGNKFSDLEILFKSPAMPNAVATPVALEYKSGGSWTSVSASDYEYVDAIQPARLYGGENWAAPTVDNIFQAWRLTYFVGYTAADDIPHALIQAIKITVADMYENRQSVIVGKIVSEIPKTAQYLMNPYKIQTL